MFAPPFLVRASHAPGESHPTEGTEGDETDAASSQHHPATWLLHRVG